MVLCVKLNAIKPLHMQFGCGGTSQLECIQKLWFMLAVENQQVPKGHHYGTSPFCVAEGLTILAVILACVVFDFSDLSFRSRSE